MSRDREKTIVETAEKNPKSSARIPTAARRIQNEGSPRLFGKRNVDDQEVTSIGRDEHDPGGEKLIQTNCLLFPTSATGEVVRNALIISRELNAFKRYR